jgi:hypothetical protein
MKSLNSDGQQFPQYQQSEQTDLILARYKQRSAHKVRDGETRTALKS